MVNLLELIPIELLDILFSYVEETLWYLYKQYPLLLTDVEWAQSYFPELLKREYYWRYKFEKMVIDYDIPNVDNNIYTAILAMLKDKLFKVSNKTHYFNKIFRVFTAIKYPRENIYMININVTAKELRQVIPSKHLIEGLNIFITKYNCNTLTLRFTLVRLWHLISVKVFYNERNSLILSDPDTDLEAELFLNLMAIKNNIN
jgi:hypothetical protein